MSGLSKLISKYVLLTILPYFIFSWLLLVVILFVQQASRYSDIFFNSNLPTNLVWQLTVALAPSVIAFTCPMAVLVGVIIGFSKMQGDSELIAMRAAGIANFQIILPIFLLGAVLSLFAFFVNLQAVPLAAQLVRQVAVQTALYKLESPIEPGVFNTEINGYTIYVRDGDIEKGVWKNVFIYNENPKDQNMRLITSSDGRIDYFNDNSELVLSNAFITTFPANSSSGKYIAENVGELRLTIKSKRSEILSKNADAEQFPEELGLADLARYAQNSDGKEKTEAQILYYRKFVLSLTPLIFSLLGATLILRFNRGGRGFGIFLALVSLILYYLAVLSSEQLARTGKINPLFAGLIPLILGVAVIVRLYFSSRRLTRTKNISFGRLLKNPFKLKSGDFQTLFKYINFRILDFDIILSLLKYIGLTFGFLGAIFLIFTSLELWKFAGIIPNGIKLLIAYLSYLIPYIYIQLAPPSIMVAILATYIIKSRQNEIISWTSAGQSVYRLLMPCFGLMLLLGIFNWEFQENILPKTNQKQDDLRSQIRNKGLQKNREGKYWVANNDKIYSFDIDDFTINSGQQVKNLTIYQFSKQDSMLQTIYRADSADWLADKIVFGENAQKSIFQNGLIQTRPTDEKFLPEKTNPLIVYNNNPSHLNTAQIKSEVENANTEIEKRNYETALQKKYTTLPLPLIITFFTAPFALSLSRRGKVITVGYAVGIWLLFMGATNVFEQFGLNNYLSPVTAVWSPLLLFALFGLYRLSKIKT